METITTIAVLVTAAVLARIASEVLWRNRVEIVNAARSLACRRINKE